MAEVHCISIGYPVEMCAFNSADEPGIIVENKCGEQVFLSQAESAIWSKYLIGGIVDDESITFNTIQKKDVILVGHNKFELMYKLTQLKPIRNGAGVRVYDEQLKCVSFNVILGREIVALNTIQKHLWYNANGNATISQIVEMIRCNGTLIDEEKLYRSIIYLVENGIMLLRR